MKAVDRLYELILSGEFLDAQEPRKLADISGRLDDTITHSADEPDQEMINGMLADYTDSYGRWVFNLGFEACKMLLMNGETLP